MAKNGKVGRKARATGAKSAKKGKPATVAANGTIPLKRICQELNVDPKRARVKLRRAIRSKDNPRAEFHNLGSRWDLTAAQAKEVRAILS